jgi:heptosyltransferase III
VPGNQILVVRGGAIGDFLLTLPVLAALRRQFPATRLEILGYPHAAQLAVAGGLADAARPIESRALAGFFAREGNLDAGLHDYFARFAIILSYLYDPDGIFQANVARCTRAQFIAGPHRPDDHGGRHATEVLLQPLERLAIFDADPLPRLALAPAPPAPGPAWLAFHPGSGSERKNWPEAHWAILLETLARETPHRFLLVGGEAEGDRLTRLARVLPPDRTQVLSGQPLLEVARALAGCRAFVGHDSGITHLAAALGVPTFVLWGPTVAGVWAPRGPHVRLLQAGDGGLGALTAAAVRAALGGL